MKNSAAPDQRDQHRLAEIGLQRPAATIVDEQQQEAR